MSRYPELEKLITEHLPEHFYGTLTIGFQNSIPGTVEVKQSFRLDTQNSRPTSRGVNNEIPRK